MGDAISEDGFRAAAGGDADALTALERVANLTAMGHVFPADEHPYPTEGVRARWRPC